MGAGIGGISFPLGHYLLRVRVKIKHIQFAGDRFDAQTAEPGLGPPGRYAKGQCRVEKFDRRVHEVGSFLFVNENFANRPFYSVTLRPTTQ
jgi:hypothetical protein